MEDAIKALEVAYNHFNEAVSQDEVDKAIYEICVAERLIAINRQV